MGLGTGELSIVPALWVGGKLAKHVFSLCMALQGGALTLGAMDPALHAAPPAWAAMSTSGFYVVSVAGFALTAYGSPVAAVTRTFSVAHDIGAAGFNSPHTILDSGTTFTYVPSVAYNALRSAIATFCATPGNCRGSVESVRGEPLCYRLASEGDIFSFPGMALTLAGADGGPPVVVDVPPHHLFLDMGWDGCVAGVVGVLPSSGQARGLGGVVRCCSDPPTARAPLTRPWSPPHVLLPFLLPPFSVRAQRRVLPGGVRQPQWRRRGGRQRHDGTRRHL
jgi:hypothetical protein